MLQPWKKVGSQSLGDFRIFKLRSDHAISPRTGKAHEFFVLDSVNWVNVVAVTPDQNLVMIEQYRHGSGTVELEVPGGMMDARDSGPEAAAMRELREETGFDGERPRVIGQVFPNPAFMSNVCYTVQVENCHCVHPVEFDHGEDLVTRLVPVSQIPELVATGTIKHSLVVVALCHFRHLK